MVTTVIAGAELTIGRYKRLSYERMPPYYNEATAATMSNMVRISIRRRGGGVQVCDTDTVHASVAWLDIYCGTGRTTNGFCERIGESRERVHRERERERETGEMGERASKWGVVDYGEIPLDEERKKETMIKRVNENVNGDEDGDVNGTKT